MRSVVLALLLLSTQARAEFYTGNDLFEHCGSSDDALLLGYLAGFEDAAERAQIAELGLTHLAGDRGEKVLFAQRAAHPYCVPPTATLGQLSDIFCQYLGKIPAERHLPASGLVSKGMTEAFPCN
jgi:Rap1a immunity proteins